MDFLTNPFFWALLCSLDNIRALGGVAIAVTALSAGIFLIVLSATLDGQESQSEVAKRALRKAFFIGLSISCLAFLPSKADVREAIMGYSTVIVTKAAIKSPQAQKLNNLSLKAIDGLEKKLDEALGMKKEAANAKP